MLRPFLLSILVIGLSGSACHKNHSPAPQVLTGKLVIANPCGHFVIQVLGGPIDPSKLAASWKDTFADTVYSKVFAVWNRSTFADAGLHKNDIFAFELDTDPPPDSKVECMIYYPTPTVQNAVKNMKKITAFPL